MKRLILLIIAIVLCASLVACAVLEEPPAPSATLKPTVAPTPSPTPVPTPTPSPVPTPSPSPIPTTTPYVQKSLTTGLPYDGQYKPVIVTIENSPAARPQLGLQTADVVYEIPVEGSITRFLCVFSDIVPSEVMPVRSARVPFLYVINEWDAIYMHFGGSGSDNKSGTEAFNVYGHKLFDDISFDVDGLYGKWNAYYYRVDFARAPHNVMGNPLLAQELYDYDPQPIAWLFDGEKVYIGEDGTQINLALCSDVSEYVSYTYDFERDVYLRSMQGKPFLAAETDAQLFVKNVIVQYSTYTKSGPVKIWAMTGGGDADIYIGGTLIKGTWQRESTDDATVYYDAEGNQIILRPGNTWIHISPYE
ncbi:MAG: DUF3048 domain-containing protein [Clostridia bacterium]|jgi:hypothetical protein|nr:DUF3048 domain-containing protein [Clostridia bacterium]MBT7121515.1 DUF3048 domain-containing protein [Clostridia bacterium]